MKKILLSLVILFLITFSAGIFYAIPLGFHTFVHKHLIEKNLKYESRYHSTLEYKSISLNNHRSEFQFQGQKYSYKIIMDSYTFTNPMENFVETQVTNLSNDDKFSFKTFFELTSSGLRFKFVFDDYEKKNAAENLLFKDVNVYVGDFTGDEKIDPKNIEFSELVKNKFILFDIGEIRIESGGQSLLFKQLEFQLGNNTADNLMTITSEGKVSEYNGIIEMKPIFFKDSNYKMDLGRFKIEELKNFDLASFQKSPNPIFAAMGLMRAIEFPVVLNFQGKSLIDSKPTELKSKLIMKTNNFMDFANNFDLEIYSQNTASNMSQIFIGFITTTYAKEAAHFYTLNADPAMTRDMKEISQTREKITQILSEDLNARQVEMMEKIAEIGYVKKNGELYQVDAKYYPGEVLINGQKQTIEEVMTMPEKVLKLLYVTPDKNRLDELLLESGLKGVNRQI